MVCFLELHDDNFDLQVAIFRKSPFMTIHHFRHINVVVALYAGSDDSSYRGHGGVLEVRGLAIRDILITASMHACKSASQQATIETYLIKYGPRIVRSPRLVGSSKPGSDFSTLRPELQVRLSLCILQERGLHVGGHID